MIEFKNGDRIVVIKSVYAQLIDTCIAEVGEAGTIIKYTNDGMYQVEFDEPNINRVFPKSLNMYPDEIDYLSEIEVSLDPSTVENLL